LLAQPNKANLNILSEGETSNGEEALEMALKTAQELQNKANDINAEIEKV